MLTDNEEDDPPPPTPFAVPSRPAPTLETLSLWLRRHLPAPPLSGLLAPPSRIERAAADGQYRIRRGNAFFANRQTAVNHVFHCRFTVLHANSAGIVRHRRVKAVTQFRRQ